MDRLRSSDYACVPALSPRFETNVRERFSPWPMSRRLVTVRADDGALPYSGITATAFISISAPGRINPAMRTPVAAG